MSDGGDLRTLVHASKNVIALRELCCPDCGGDVVLEGALLLCDDLATECEWVGEALVELAVRASPRAPEPPSPRAPEPGNPPRVGRTAP